MRAIATTQFGPADLDRHADLFLALCRARKSAFVDALGWDLPHDAGLEIDQYDFPFSRWTVLHDAGEVLAGLRLTPTTQDAPAASYMIRDAQRGRLPGLPDTLLDAPAPVSDDLWELSRVFLAPDLRGTRAIAVRAAMADAIMTSGMAVGARRLVTLTTHMWSRWHAKYGVPLAPLGPRIGGARWYQVVEVDILDNPVTHRLLDEPAHAA